MLELQWEIGGMDYEAQIRYTTLYTLTATTLKLRDEEAGSSGKGT